MGEIKEMDFHWWWGKKERKRKKAGAGEGTYELLLRRGPKWIRLTPGESSSK